MNIEVVLAVLTFCLSLLQLLIDNSEKIRKLVKRIWKLNEDLNEEDSDSS